jgi:opacity protein-like surface antigen
MRVLITAAVAAIGVLSMPVGAFAQTSLQGFGALPIDHLSSLGDSGVPLDFGGGVAFEIAPGVQVMGEFGKLGNVMPKLVETGLAFTPIGLTASAFYGEGGVRLMAAPRSPVSPYVEGTAGVAHLRFGARGLGSTTDALIRAALNLVDTRDPMFGAGGGLLMRAGALQVDLGYRYKKIAANSALSSILGLGQDLQSHQVRFGAGVRF